MKLRALILSFLLISSLSTLGCSDKRTDDKTVNKKTVVKMPITKAPEEKGAKPDTVVKKSPQATEVKEAETTQTEEKLPQAKPTNETKAPAEDRLYTAGGDEGLSMIAGRSDVYGDPLKWILIYRFNRDAFEGDKKDEAFPDKNVPAGTMLKIAAPVASVKDTGDHYVVNVLSSPEGERIAPYAIKLVDNGFSVYITKADVKGQEYTRLRVGFYDKRIEAEEAGQKIIELLNVTDLWTANAGELEFNEYGGYK